MNTWWSSIRRHGTKYRLIVLAAPALAAAVLGACSQGFSDTAARAEMSDPAVTTDVPAGTAGSSINYHDTAVYGGGV